MEQTNKQKHPFEKSLYVIRKTTEGAIRFLVRSGLRG